MRKRSTDGRSAPLSQQAVEIGIQRHHECGPLPGFLKDLGVTGLRHAQFADMIHLPARIPEPCCGTARQALIQQEAQVRQPDAR
jgi:hypothetical protein